MRLVLGALAALTGIAGASFPGFASAAGKGRAGSSTASNARAVQTRQGPVKPRGTLTVYAALTSQNGDALAKAFHQFDPNAQVDIITGGTGDLVTRIEAEARAKSLHADVVLLADPTVMATLTKEGLLASYKPAAAKKLPASLQGQNWVGAFTFHNVIVFHRGMTLPIPKTWTDLKKPEYDQQIELADPSYSGTTLAMVGYLSQKYGWGFFRTLRQHHAVTQSSTNTVGTDVAAGRVQVGISLDSVAFSLQKKGSPIEVVWPQDGAIPVPAPVSIVAGKDNALTEAFVDWLLSPAGQQAVAQLGLAPVNGRAPMVPSGAKMVSVNWSDIGAKRSIIIQRFEAIFS